MGVGEQVPNPLVKVSTYLSDGYLSGLLFRQDSICDNTILISSKVNLRFLATPLNGSSDEGLG